MSGPNEWHDYLRIVAFAICLYSLVKLLRRYDSEWNIKTKDLWYALVMWILAGCVFAAQGVLLNRPFTVGFVFLTAATLVSGKGLARKGAWGSDSS